LERGKTLTRLAALGTLSRNAGEGLQLIQEKREREDKPEGIGG
jgi:hypothetical protein